MIKGIRIIMHSKLFHSSKVGHIHLITYPKLLLVTVLRLILIIKELSYGVTNWLGCQAQTLSMLSVSGIR